MKLSELFEQNGFDLGNLKESFDLIDGISKHIIAESDEVLAKQHQISENIYFLIKGKATFTKYFETKSITFAKITKPATPLGISGLNQPNRFMGEIFIEGGTEYISIKLDDLRDLQQKNSKLISTLYSAISFFSFQLLVSSRNLNTLYKDDEIQISPGIPSEKSITNIHRIKSATFFSTLTDDDLEKFIKLGNIKMYSSNQYIVKEGDASKGLKILLSGKVDGLFHNFINGKIRRNFRTLTRAGIALTLSSGKGDFFNPYTIKSTRDTKVLHISNEALENLIISDPELSIKIFKRQLWQLGRFQQSATGLTKYSAENELEFVNLLLKDNTARIPASSKLYSIPHLLKSTHTYAMAFDVVYELLIKGNEIEKSLSSLIKDTLNNLERESRFHSQLNIIYNRVSNSSSNSDKTKLRELTNSNFTKAFDNVKYVIKGWENLPDEPTNIFFYNHLAAIDDNQLANGHSFSIDSHFISSKILHPKYNDGGQRIVRTSRNTEFWRYNYYENLDYIFVHTPESDKLDESEEEKKLRKQKLFDEAQKVFNKKQPIVIAPEGTSETEDNKTITSPGPFKSGAFNLAFKLNPKPKLIPIALANFDYPVSKTIYSAVIKEPITISDHVKDPENQEEMKSFLDNYRTKFRSYVEEAIDLAKNVQDNIDKIENLKTNVNLVSPVEEEFELDVRELEHNSFQQKNTNNSVALYGSSTFKLWDNAKNDLSINNLYNLGFGGSTLVSCRRYFDRLVAPLNPSNLFFYAGDNDIGYGMDSDELLKEFLLFSNQVEEKLPRAKCFFISIKPSPFRRDLMSTILDANSKIKKHLTNLKMWDYVDITTPMINAGYDKFYDEDPLHMNELGYSLLSKLVRDKIYN